MSHRKCEATVEVDSWRSQVTEHVNTHWRSTPKKRKCGRGRASYFRCLEVNLRSAMEDRIFQCWLEMVSNVERKWHHHSFQELGAEMSSTETLWTLTV
jgi:hypothetical protein